MSQAKTGGGEAASVTPRTFYLAALLFAANLAVFLRVDRRAFLSHADAAWKRISAENARRQGRTVDPPPG